MKILFLVKRWYSGQDLLTSGFGRYGHLPQGLQQIGHEVNVIALDKGNHASICKNVDGTQYQSVPITRSLSRLSSMIRQIKPDVLIVGGHLWVALLGKHLAKSFHIPWIFDVYDYYPSFLGRWAFLGQPLFNRLLRQANAISAASPALAEIIPRADIPVKVVRNATDIPQQRFSREESRAYFKLPSEAFIAGYLGRLANYVMVNETLAALQELPAPHPSVLFVQIGPRESRFRSFPNLHQLGNFPSADVGRFICACDLLLAPYLDCPQVRFSNACKLSEYSAWEAVVVASRNGDYASYLPENYPGLYHPNEPKSLEKAVLKQTQSPVSTQPSPVCFWSNSIEALAQLLRC